MTTDRPDERHLPQWAQRRLALYRKQIADLEGMRRDLSGLGDGPSLYDVEPMMNEIRKAAEAWTDKASHKMFQGHVANEIAAQRAHLLRMVEALVGYLESKCCGNHCPVDCDSEDYPASCLLAIEMWAEAKAQKPLAGGDDGQ